MKGYAESVGQKEAKKVAAKIREIEKRGRYVADREWNCFLRATANKTATKNLVEKRNFCRLLKAI